MTDKSMQWFFLRLIALWLVLFIAPIVAYCLTKSPLYLTSYAAYTAQAHLLSQLMKQLFPPGDNETKNASDKRCRKGRTP